MRTAVVMGILSTWGVCSAIGDQLRFEEQALADLVKQVPGILQTFEPKTRWFGAGIGICQD